MTNGVPNLIGRRDFNKILICSYGTSHTVAAVVAVTCLLYPCMKSLKRDAKDFPKRSGVFCRDGLQK